MAGAVGATAGLDVFRRAVGNIPDRVKSAAGWITEKASRLKLNG